MYTGILFHMHTTKWFSYNLFEHFQFAEMLNILALLFSSKEGGEGGQMFFHNFINYGIKGVANYAYEGKSTLLYSLRTQCDTKQTLTNLFWLPLTGSGCQDSNNKRTIMTHEKPKLTLKVQYNVSYLRSFVRWRFVNFWLASKVSQPHFPRTDQPTRAAL